MSGAVNRARANYRRVFKDKVKIARATGTGAAANIAWDEFKWVRAHLSGYSPAPVGGDQMQGNQRFMLLAEDLESIGFAVPPRNGDRIRLDDDRVVMVQYCDSNTRRINGVVLAYVCEVKGT